jgi:hypothetical protein
MFASGAGTGWSSGMRARPSSSSGGTSKWSRTRAWSGRTTRRMTVSRSRR